MVFKTLGTSLGNFVGKSFESTIKDFKLSGGNIVSTLFKSSDTIALQKFNQELKKGVDNHIAYRSVMSTASDTAKKQASSYIRCQNDLKRYTNQLNANKIGQEEYNARVDATRAKMVTLGVETQALTIKERALTAATKVMSTAFQLAKMAIVTIAFNVIIAGITKLVNRQKELTEQAKESAEEVNSQTKAIEDLKKKYAEICDSTEDEKAKNEQLNEIKQELIDTYGIEKDKLADLNLEREKGLDLLDQEFEKNNRNARNEWLDENEKVIQKSKEKMVSGGTDYFSTYLSEDNISESILKLFDKKEYFGDTGYVNLEFDYDDTVDRLEKLQNIYNQILDIKSKRKLSDDEEQLLSEVKSTLNSVQKIYDENYEIYSTSSKFKAQNLFDNYIKTDTGKLEDVGKETFQAWKNGLIEQASNAEEKRQLENLIEEQFPELSEYFTNLNTVYSKFGIGDVIRNSYEAIKKSFIDSLSIDDLNIAMQIPDLFANGLDAAKQKIADFNSSSDSKINVSVNSDDDISEITDNVSKKVKLISTAMEEMNDTGSISSSTYGEIVEMGGNFTDCLEVQNGKLTLNVQRLKELETQEFETAKAATELAIAELQANSSINSASDFALYEEKLKELKKQQAFYQTLIDDINNAAPSSSETSNTETKETEPKSVTDFKAEYARKQHEINMGRMEEDEDYYSWLEKAAHTAYDGLKDYEDDLWKYEEEVYKGRKQLADDFYDEQQKDLDDRISALENNIETATEYSTDINGNNLDLEEKIDYISSAYREIINEINGRIGEILDIGIEGHEDDVAELEEQIEEYQKKLDGVFDDVFKTAAENEKEYIENLKDKYSNLYDERIDKIKEQQEAAEKSAQAEVDAIQEKIDKLKKSNEKEQEALDIAKARRELEKASQATRQVYGADGTISFEADEEKIQEAQENLNNLLLEQQTNILEEQKELLEQTKDKQSEAYDSIIDNLEAEKENEEKRFDILLDVLNEYLNPEQDKSNSEVWKILSHIEGASYKNGVWADKDGNTINLDELINSVDKKIEDKQNASEHSTDKNIDKKTTSSNNDKKTDVIISGTLERLVLGSKTSDTQDNNIKDSYNKFLSSLENKLGLNDGTLVFEKIKKAFANTYGAANNSYMNISERMGNIGRGYTNTVNNNNNNASNVNIGDIIINNPVTNSNDLAKELMLNLPNAFQKQMYTNLK